MDDPTPEERAKKVAVIGQCRESLIKANYVKMRVKSHTMHPTIQFGDVVKVIKSDVKNMQIGEVIFIIKGDDLVAHRIIDKETSPGRVILTTKGDAASEPDPPVAEKLVMGKVVELERKGKIIKVKKDLRFVPKDKKKKHFIKKFLFWK